MTLGLGLVATVAAVELTRRRVRAKLEYTTLATEFVSDEVKGNPGIYPPAETLAKAFALTAHTPEFDEVLTRTWTRIKTGQ